MQPPVLHASMQTMPLTLLMHFRRNGVRIDCVAALVDAP